MQAEIVNREACVSGFRELLMTSKAPKLPLVRLKMINDNVKLEDRHYTTAFDMAEIGLHAD